MNYHRLGRSGLLVSDVCLGTMTFGSQVSESDSLRILDRAFESGINFFDTAEAYATPMCAETYGASERILGKWLRSKPRDSVILATKIAGPNGGIFGNIVPHIRGGGCALDWHNFAAAVEGSLTRLGTDTIDLYQTHWPDRQIPVETQLEALARLVEEGKIRYAGVSNETPWGLTRFAATAEFNGLPPVVSVQNVYHLLKREFEDGMAEACVREDIGMIAYSAIAMGVLTGKYSGGALPSESRMAQYPSRFRDRYTAPRVLAAADRYVAIAKAAAINPAAMAVAWVRTRPTVAAALPGCTSILHLDSILAGAEMTLSDDVVEAIDVVHADIKNPVI